MNTSAASTLSIPLTKPLLSTVAEAVNVPGVLTFNLLQLSLIPNLLLILTKISPDINYVKYVLAMGDTILGGATFGILADNSPDLGTATYKVKGN